jgi:type VI secretion system secreted protein Hcp
MADDIFIKIGNIPGESTDSKHKDWIQIESFSWGLRNPGSTIEDKRRKGVAQDFRFTKTLDKSSPLLALATFNGKFLSDAMLTVRKAGGDQVEYLHIKLTDILVSSYSPVGEPTDPQSPTGSSELPMESFSLNFSKIEFKYTPQLADGSLGEPVSFEWDLATGKGG